MKSFNYLRFLRTAAAIAVFALFIGLFASWGMTVPSIAAWLARVQILPAAMAFSITAFLSWLIVTLFFGRIYCSVFCPLGIFQDIAARLPRIGKRNKSRREYHYSPPLNSWRRISLVVVAVSIVLGISLVTSLLDPYSIFARFGYYVVKPLWGLILDGLYAVTGYPPVRIALGSLLGFSLAVVTMAAIGAVAFRNGRTFCNSLCPVGTTLSFVSKYSLFHIDINTDLCTQCRRCEHSCKASCIDLTSHVVDMSRCVVCFDCLSACPDDAIRYTFNRHQLSIPLMQKVQDPLAGTAAGMDAPAGSPSRLLDRRRFLMAGAVVAMAPVVAKASEAAASVESGTSGRRLLHVTPPGASSRKEFLDRCTSCGLCIDRCPQKVLKPSLGEYGLLRALHPVMDFDSSWCVYDCTLCSNLCPTGALRPLTEVVKHHSRIGLAVVDRFGCVSWENGVSCGACERRCPSGAIEMVSVDGGNGPLPSVDPEKCVGCGACQYVCPSHPKAIMVGGIV